MEKRARKNEVDMCNGPLLSKIIVFAIPVVLSGVLQLFFNAADVVVVGRFAGKEALAAVGSTSSLINLLVNLFIGLSVGTNVLVARFYGAGKEKDVSDTVHTSICLALISGVILIFVGLLFTRPLLVLMGSPEDVLPLSAVYLKIYFLGMPAMMVYNFGAAILRAVGDTKRPMIYLTLSGILNVVLNLIFVIPLRLSVVGVALATTISQFLSAGLVVAALLREEGMCRLELKKLKLSANKVGMILRVGLPAGLQGCIFSISNVLIQSSVNSFNSTVMAGNTAGSSIEGFVYVSMNAFHQTSVSIVSQNFGAKKIKRIKKTAIYCLIMVTIVGLVVGNGAYLLADPLLRLYTKGNPALVKEVVRYGTLRMSFICTTYCLCGIMDTLVGIIRGLGYSVMPMIVSLLGACAFRIVWIYTVFRQMHTLEVLYISYPISWALTATVHFICLMIVWRKVKQKMEEV